MTPETFKQHIQTFVQQESATRKRFVLDERNFMPILNEDTVLASFDRQYIYHVAWACRTLKKINPSLHYDFSSSLNFITTASAWYPIRFCDIRPAEIQLDNLSIVSENLTRLSMPDNSLESISCMHVVEHVGLGRYGDGIDYDGDLKAVKELKRVVRHGGNLLFVVPVGKHPVIQYNAHRIYSWEMVLEMFADEFVLVESALIPEQGHVGLVHTPSKALLDSQNYACGCFWFQKK